MKKIILILSGFVFLMGCKKEAADLATPNPYLQITTNVASSGDALKVTIGGTPGSIISGTVDYGDGQTEAFSQANTISINHAYNTATSHTALVYFTSDALNITSIVATDSVSKITAVGGLKNVRNLKLFVIEHQQLFSIDLSDNTHLKGLGLNGNKLTSVDVTKNIELDNLEINDNLLTGIDVSKNTQLKTLNMVRNVINNIDITNNVNLINLTLFNNQLTGIDVSKNILLQSLSLENNLLLSINVSQNIALKNFLISNNKLTVIDVTKNVSLESLTIFSNNITTLDISKNTSLAGVSAAFCNLTPVSVNSILIDASAIGMTKGFVTLQGQTPSASPFGAGLSAKSNMISAGRIVYTD